MEFIELFKKYVKEKKLYKVGLKLSKDQAKLLLKCGLIYIMHKKKINLVIGFHKGR